MLARQQTLPGGALAKKAQMQALIDLEATASAPPRRSAIGHVLQLLGQLESTAQQEAVQDFVADEKMRTQCALRIKGFQGTLDIIAQNYAALPNMQDSYDRMQNITGDLGVHRNALKLRYATEARLDQAIRDWTHALGLLGPQVKARQASHKRVARLVVRLERSFSSGLQGNTTDDFGDWEGGEEEAVAKPDKTKAGALSFDRTARGAPLTGAIATSRVPGIVETHTLYPLGARPSKPPWEEYAVRDASYWLANPPKSLPAGMGRKMTEDDDDKDSPAALAKKAEGADENAMNDAFLSIEEAAPAAPAAPAATGAQGQGGEVEKAEAFTVPEVPSGVRLRAQKKHTSVDEAHNTMLALLGHMAFVRQSSVTKYADDVGAEAKALAGLLAAVKAEFARITQIVSGLEFAITDIEKEKVQILTRLNETMPERRDLEDRKGHATRKLRHERTWCKLHDDMYAGQFKGRKALMGTIRDMRRAVEVKKDELKTMVQESKERVAQVRSTLPFMLPVDGELSATGLNAKDVELDHANGVLKLKDTSAVLQLLVQGMMKTMSSDATTPEKAVNAGGLGPSRAGSDVNASAPVMDGMDNNDLKLAAELGFGGQTEMSATEKKMHENMKALAKQFPKKEPKKPVVVPPEEVRASQAKVIAAVDNVQNNINLAVRNAQVQIEGGGQGGGGKGARVGLRQRREERDGVGWDAVRGRGGRLRWRAW
jgi:hypothetical protein